METLYHQTNCVIQDVQNAFQKLEQTGSNSNESDRSDMSNYIDMKIQLIHKNCDKLDTMLHKVSINQRSTFKIRFDQLKVDNRHLQKALENWRQKQQRKRMEHSEREQLISRKWNQKSEQPETDKVPTTIQIDNSLQHHSQLQHSNRHVDELLFTGSQIVESLRSQRTMLKNARERMLNLANTLGMSNDTIRIIQRRVQEDKWIFYGGILSTLLIICFVMAYFRTAFWGKK